MKVLFFGYSQIGYRAVHLLADRGDDVLAVVTHRDDPEENRWYRTPAEAARAHDLPVVYAEDLGEQMGAYAERLAPHLVLSVLYRKLLPQRVLDSARLAAVNLHPSYLPAYRGRAPINWVLVRGERETGVTLHHMTRRADAGNIIVQRRIEIEPRETALTLYHKIEEAGVAVLDEGLRRIEAGQAEGEMQDESRASYFGARRPEDGRIDWSWPAERIDCLVRAVAPPWPGAFGDIGGQRVFIHQGEPATRISESERSRFPPGTMRLSGDTMFMATGDRWFRVDSFAKSPQSRHLHSTEKDYKR